MQDPTLRSYRDKKNEFFDLFEDESELDTPHKQTYEEYVAERLEIEKKLKK